MAPPTPSTGERPWLAGVRLQIRMPLLGDPSPHGVRRIAGEPRSRFAIRRQAQTLGLNRPQRGRPKPKGASWSTEEHAVLRAYATGEISYTELCTQLPGRSWDAIASQGRVLGLQLRQKGVYY